MGSAMGVRISPEAALARWPEEWPLVVLWSGEGDAAGRWVVLGRPRGWGTAGVATREELRSVLDMTPRETRAKPRCVALTETSGECGLELPLVVYGLEYEIGRVIESAVEGRECEVGEGEEGSPTRRVGVPKTAKAPEAMMVMVDDALVFDRRTGGAWAFGDLRVEELEARAAPSAFEVGTLRSEVGRRGYEDGVGRALEYIRAGDVYQVNLSHKLRGSFRGSTRGLLAAMLEGARPRYGAYIEGEERAIISMSPESFLEFDAGTRRVVTRPMKGTRAAGEFGRGAAELGASAKDRAELAMIVDLMRNDLGRVCVPGSMRVDAARRIEAHAAHAGGGVLQATAEISGTLRGDRSLPDLIMATFPGGSVTGAPKIRAMQIIEELERGPRGMYCGAIGYQAADGSAAFNIAIRTATVENRAASAVDGGAIANVDPRFGTIEDGELIFPVGAGIVADSDPASEWEETMVKAGVVERVAVVKKE